LPVGSVTEAGDLHGCQPPPSTEHVVVAFGSLTVHANRESWDAAIAAGVDVKLTVSLAVAGRGGAGGGGESLGATAEPRIVHL
jgi:hypothetical protein